MPKDLSIKKVLVIGSGPIVIGQAAEFDFAGAQACRVLKSEGVEAVLVNCNPATIMTDFSMAILQTGRQVGVVDSASLPIRQTFTDSWI